MFLMLLKCVKNNITSEMDDIGHFQPVRSLPFV